MNSATSIAVSGLAAASLRLEASASNVAHMRSRGPLPATPPGRDVPQETGQVYQARQAVQTSDPQGGVSARLQTSLPSYRTAFDPAAPYANAAGMVAEPYVDIAAEFVNLIQARTAFGANLAVIRAAQRSDQALFDLIV